MEQNKLNTNVALLTDIQKYSKNRSKKVDFDDKMIIHSVYVHNHLHRNFHRDVDFSKSFRGPPVEKPQIKDFCVQIHFLRDREIDFIKWIHNPDGIKMIAKVFSLSKIV